MTAIGHVAQRRTACMLTAEVGFVMSSVGFLSVGRSLFGRGPHCPATTGPGRRRAKCTTPKCHHCKLQPKGALKYTQVIDFNEIIDWHETCNTSPTNPFSHGV